jgi:hypothetical protein
MAGCDRETKEQGVVSFFRLCCVAALIGFVALGLARRHAGHGPDAFALSLAHLRATGHQVGAPAKSLWDVPSVTVSVEGCSTPVKLVPMDFDDIVSPGIMRAALMAEHETYRIDYAGHAFEKLDRASLYRLRLRNDIIQLIRTHDIAEPPVILSFWPADCAPRAIF